MKPGIKKGLKRLAQVCGYVVALPFGLLGRYSGSKQIFVGLGECLSLIPEPVGSYIRVGYYRQTLKRCSRDVFIGFGTFFTQPDAEVEEFVNIAGFCVIGKVRIERHATLGVGVQVLSGKSQHMFREIDVPILEQKGGHLERVTIGENCWIGNGSIIMANLGRQNVIAAGSVVIRDTGDYEVHGGNPAKLIERFHEAAKSPDLTPV